MRLGLILVKRLAGKSACFVLVPPSLWPILAMAQTPASAGSTPTAPSASAVEHDPLVDAAFEHFYNLEYDRSIQEFEKMLDRHPADPSAVNHLLSTVLMRELYRMGAMNSGEYANDSFIGNAHRAADPKVKERIKELVDRAETLEEEELKANPNNVDALYARGVTRAQFSLYTALVERAWFSALRNAVGARHDHERVLELNPNYVDAKARVLMHDLARSYPRNYLFPLEEARRIYFAPAAMCRRPRPEIAKYGRTGGKGRTAT